MNMEDAITFGELRGRVKALEEKVAALEKKDPKWMRDLLKASPFKPAVGDLVDNVYGFDAVYGPHGVIYCRAYKVQTSGPLAMCQRLSDILDVQFDLEREFKTFQFNAVTYGHRGCAMIGFSTPPGASVEKAVEMEAEIIGRVMARGFHIEHAKENP